MPTKICSPALPQRIAKAEQLLPHQPTPAEQLRLGQLDSDPLGISSTYGEIFANKILVKCP